jgi:TRAP-type C4-dicarboxylate transport system substrate-binding protein
MRIALCVLALALGGCSLGGEPSDDRKRAPPSTASGRTVTVRFAGDSGLLQSTFIDELKRVSDGRLRAESARYEPGAADDDRRIAHDVARGRLDLAVVSARAWESLGVTSLRAFQSPFLLTSDALLDRATSDPRVTRPLLRSLAELNVTGLAFAPAGVRYLLSAREPLRTPRAFAGARIRIQASLTGEDILRQLRARAAPAVPGGRAVVDALRDGRLDAVEADMRSATRNGYVAAAPHVGSPLFAEVATIVVGTDRLRHLGPEAAAWIRAAATRAAAVQRRVDDRASWATACGAGLKPTASTPAQLDALHAAVLDVHAGLDGDNTAALAIDRMGLMAVRERVTDAWARCEPRAAASPTVLDGAYEVTISERDASRAGWQPGNAGPFRLEVGHGRYAIFHSGPADPEWPNWDFSRDPVEVGTVLVHGDEALFRPETAIRVGSKPATFRFELFRDRVRWRHVSGDEAAVFDVPIFWRKVN